MQTVGAVALDLNLNEKGFNSQLKSIGNMAKKVGATIAGAFAIKKSRGLWQRLYRAWVQT